MTAVRAVPVEERRARLARRHELAPGTGSPSVAHAAERMVGIHATDPGTVFLSARARIPGFTVEALESAMYERGQVVGGWAVRRGGEVVVRTFEDVGSAAAAALEVEAARLTEWLDGTAVSPRFPTPRDRELRA